MDHGGPAHDTGPRLAAARPRQPSLLGVRPASRSASWNAVAPVRVRRKWTSLAISAPFGAVSGFVAASVVRRLQQKGTTSQVTDSDIIGLIGRVLVPPPATGQGKVRVRVKASYVDYVARARRAVEEGDTVVVEEVEDGVVTVMPGPKELKGSHCQQ